METERIYNLLKNNFKIIALGLLLFGCLSLSGSPVEAQNSSDAIAIRILPNPNNYSALRWYKERNLPGSPQSLIVDGYEAVRDERTVIVNVANIYAGNLYTNIYLISYNQEAERATTDIFSQILKHWRFNTNLTITGFCREAAIKNNDRITCLVDQDCPIGDKCDSTKARVARDTRRLADLADIRVALDKYRIARGHYPKLGAGTYLANQTISTWPSWRETFGRELGITLPVDPVNKLGPCEGFNEITCWNEHTKKFVVERKLLHNNSLVYMYFTDANGAEIDQCAVFESGFKIAGVSISDSCPEVCLDFDSDGYGRPASKACLYEELDCNDSDDTVTFPKDPEICNSGGDDDCDGLIDCDDADCIGDPVCATWPPAPPATDCGNGVVEEPWETCDDGPGSPRPCPISCDDGNPCTHNIRTGNAADCNVICSNPPIDITCNTPGQPNCQATEPTGAVAGIGTCCAGQSCYVCPAGTTWNGIICAPICTSESDADFCNRLGTNCGSVTALDNCGSSRTVNCGDCVAPETCGGGGVANVCGLACTSESDAAFCNRLGANCDSVTALDNCGSSRTVNCGDCVAPETCGGGGVANVCGLACTSESDADFCNRLGANCGSVTALDNCGSSRTVNCGDCVAPEVCAGGGVANVCGLACTPTTCAAQGKNCGDISDGCGGTLDCGSCTAPEVCAGGGVANVCGVNSCVFDFLFPCVFP